MSMIGRTISHYRIVERLGGGGMGVVYRAEDTKLDRSVAIKFLPPQWVDDPEAKDRFVREAKAASALDHPNICTIYEIGETDDGQLFLAMAYYEGQTLKRRLEDGPLPIADAVEIVRQLAEGLAKTHLRDILHRDIKPPNVFLTPEGQVKLLDFGLAKIIGEGVTLTGMTQGTPAYMAPELIRGERATPQTDLWSLGVLLYESLVGQRPFGGRSIPSIVHAVHTGEPRPVRLLRPEVPATLERITARLLAKDPRDRYTSCRELLDDLAVVDVGASTESGSRSFGPISAASFSRPGSGALPSDLQHGTRLGTKSKILLALTLLAVVVGSALFLRRDTPVAHPSRTAPPTVSINQGSPPEPTEIAVLFFDNASGDPSIEWIRTALPDMLVTDLSQSPQISVLSTSRVYQAVDDLEPLASGKLSLTLLEALLERIASIDRIVLGQLFQVGPTLHVEARMQSAQGEILDSWSFEGKGEESLFEIADRLSLEIRQGIEISNALGRLPDRDIADITTGSVDALRAYIAGLTDHMRYDEKAAFDHFLKAVDLDPEFTLAWAKLAITARNLSRPEAFEYAQRALADADRLSSQERDYIVGFTAGQDTRRWREAVEALGRAVERDPDHQAARIGLAMILGALEVFPEAIHHGEELVRRRYYPGSHAILAQLYAAVGDSPAAARMLERFARDQPGFVTETAWGWHFLRTGDLEAARNHFLAADAAKPGAAYSFVGRCATDLLAEAWTEVDALSRRQMAAREPSERLVGILCRILLARHQGRSEEALQQIRGAIEHIPVPGPRAIFRLLAVDILRDLEDTRAAYDEALLAREEGRGSFRENQALFEAGRAAASLGRVDEARRLADALLELAEEIPGNKELRRHRHLLGEIALAQGDTAGALVELETAAAMLPAAGVWSSFGEPPHAGIWWSLARARRAAGDIAGEREMLEKIVEAREERVFEPEIARRAQARLEASNSAD